MPILANNEHMFFVFLTIKSAQIKDTCSYSTGLGLVKVGFSVGNSLRVYISMFLMFIGSFRCQCSGSVFQLIDCSSVAQPPH